MDLPVWVPSVVMFLGILLISLNFWYLVYVPKTQPSLSVSNKQITDEEAEEAYKKLLMYIQSHIEKGQKFINDFKKRTENFAELSDEHTIMEKYRNPLL
jgi:CHASE1-domain containing sensor protein